jgi:long-subunit fatty acid transport protein
MTDEFLRDIEQNGVDKARAESHDAWQTYVVDFDSVSRSFYTPFVYGSSNNRILENGVRQRILVNSSGRTNDNTFAIGLDVNNMVYVGGSINITSLVFNERFEYSETDDMNRVPSFDRYALSRDLRQTGRGVNLRTGIIVTPNKKIRLGVSYHFPTSWTVNELYSSYTNSHFSTSAGNKSYTSPSSGNGDYSNSYSIITPGRAIVGASVVLFKSLIVATDYEYCRFNRASFTSSDDWVSVENTIIGQELRAAGALKCGAELRVGPLRLRGGSAFYQNPYTRYDNTLKNCQSIYSGGVGIKSKSTTFDVSMSRSFSKNYKYIYTDYDGYERVVGSGISEVHLLMSFGLLL